MPIIEVLGAYRPNSCNLFRASVFRCISIQDLQVRFLPYLRAAAQELSLAVRQRSGDGYSDRANRRQSSRRWSSASEFAKARGFSVPSGEATALQSDVANGLIMSCV